MKLPQRKHGQSELYSNLRDYLDYYSIEYTFGFNQINFLNATFTESKEISGLKPLSGYFFNLRYNKALPLILELEYSSAILKLKNEDYFDFKKEEKVSYKGLKASASFILLPSANFFTPYIGFGYGHFSNSVGSNFFGDKKRYYKFSTEMPFWKIGFSLNFSEQSFLNVAYEQSADVDNQMAYNQFKIGLGVRAEEDSDRRENVADFFEENGIILSIGYHQTNFLNTAFINNIEEGNIKREIGASVNMRITSAYPVMFDIGYFSSQFTVEDLPDWPNDSTKVRHRGAEIAILLPLLSKRLFLPYTGLGYQYSQLYTGEPPIENTTKDYDHIVKMAVNTSSPIYKVGVMMVFNAATFNVEYKHSAFNKKLPFYQLAVNIGFNF